VTHPNPRPDSSSAAPQGTRRRQVTIGLSLLLALLAIGSYGYAESQRSEAALSPTAAPHAATAVVETMAPRDPSPAVATALRSRYAAFLSQPLTLTFGDRSWRPSLAELGAQLDLDAAADAIVTAGQAEEFLEGSPVASPAVRLSPLA
jgi:hypothetical protein